MFYSKVTFRNLVRYVTGVALFILACVWFAPGPGRLPVVILVKRGATVGTIASQLRHDGAIRSVSLFKIWARLRRFRPIRGEYIFKARASMYSVTKKLKSGDINYTSISVPPGGNAWTIQRSLGGFISEKTFWTLWRNPRFTAIAGFPNADSMEGLIAPLVYRLNHAQDPEEIFLKLAETFRDRVKPTLDGGHLPPYETLTLASMIEKETSIPQEMPLVAGVYSKRIDLRMKLQCDPTALYARWHSGDLHFSAPTKYDICRKSNFNTYAIFGLPPTPIASPSQVAISAAKLPHISSNIYFAATGKGGHAFAGSLSEHSQNVKRYRNELVRKLSVTKG